MRSAATRTLPCNLRVRRRPSRLSGVSVHRRSRWEESRGGLVTNPSEDHGSSQREAGGRPTLDANISNWSPQPHALAVIGTPRGPPPGGTKGQPAAHSAHHTAHERAQRAGQVRAAAQEQRARHDPAEGGEVLWISTQRCSALPETAFPRHPPAGPPHSSAGIWNEWHRHGDPVTRSPLGRGGAMFHNFSKAFRELISSVRQVIFGEV